MRNLTIFLWQNEAFVDLKVRNVISREMTESVGSPGFLAQIGIMMFSIISGSQLSRLMDCLIYRMPRLTYLSQVGTSVW